MRTSAPRSRPLASRRVMGLHTYTNSLDGVGKVDLPVACFVCLDESHQNIESVALRGPGLSIH
jgi:hypothetical protein